jgi:replication factor A1
VTSFRSCSLNIGRYCRIHLNPQTEKAFQLKAWYLRALRTKDIRSFCKVTKDKGERSTLKLNIYQLTTSPLDGIVTMPATIAFIKKETSYIGCGTSECSKKVDMQPNGFFECFKCGWKGIEPLRKFSLRCTVVDPSGTLWVTMFGVNAQLIFDGMSADELEHLREDVCPKSFLFFPLPFHILLDLMRYLFQIYSLDSRAGCHCI